MALRRLSSEHAQSSGVGCVKQWVVFSCGLSGLHLFENETELACASAGRLCCFGLKLLYGVCAGRECHCYLARHRASAAALRHVVNAGDCGLPNPRKSSRQARDERSSRSDFSWCPRGCHCCPRSVRGGHLTRCRWFGITKAQQPVLGLPGASWTSREVTGVHGKRRLIFVRKMRDKVFPAARAKIPPCGPERFSGRMKQSRHGHGRAWRHPRPHERPHVALAALDNSLIHKALRATAIGLGRRWPSNGGRHGPSRAALSSTGVTAPRSLSFARVCLRASAFLFSAPLALRARSHGRAWAVTGHHGHPINSAQGDTAGEPMPL